MKASELIKKVQEAINANGDRDVIIAANRHSYKDVVVVSRENEIVLSLFDKVED